MKVLVLGHSLRLEKRSWLHHWIPCAKT